MFRAFSLFIIFVLCVGLNGDPVQILRRNLFNAKIVGGRETNISLYPFQVALLYRDHHVCGGAILGETWIVTAAHCVEFASPESFSIRAGSNFHAEGGVVIPIAEIIEHPNYNHYTLNYDISLVMLKESIVFDSTKMPIGYIMHDANVADGAMASVTGWGETRNYDESTDSLRVVNVPVINQEVCNSIYTFFGGVDDEMICAGSLDGGAGFCQGDNGGPLIAGNILIGIVSWSYDCAQPGYPGVYTRIAHVAPWIFEVSGIPYGCC